MTQEGSALPRVTGPQLYEKLAVVMLAMADKLLSNRHKGGWQNETFSYLFGRMRQEQEELMVAVTIYQEAPSEENRQRVLKEVADVCNFAMMVADNVGALP